MSDGEVALLCPRRTMENGTDWCILTNHAASDGVLFGNNCFEDREAGKEVSARAVAPFGVNKTAFEGTENITIQVPEGSAEYDQLKVWHDDAVAKIGEAFADLDAEMIRSLESAYGGVRFIDDGEVCAQFKLRIARQTLLFQLIAAKKLVEGFKLNQLSAKPTAIIAKVSFATLWANVSEEGLLESWGMHFTAPGVVFQKLDLKNFKYNNSKPSEKKMSLMFDSMFSPAEIAKPVMNKRRKLNNGSVAK